MSQQTITSHSPDNEDGCLVAMDKEDDGIEPPGITEEAEANMGSWLQEGTMDSRERTILEFPDKLLYYVIPLTLPGIQDC